MLSNVNSEVWIMDQVHKLPHCSTAYWCVVVSLSSYYTEVLVSNLSRKQAFYFQIFGYNLKIFTPWTKTYF
jgi:hypothetical protein